MTSEPDAWSAATWEGSRRAQLRLSLRLTVRERLAVLEELARTSEALVAPGRGGLRPGASKQEEC